MADSVAMIDAMVGYLNTLPKLNNGDIKVSNPTAVAVEFIGIVAPLYQADYDESEVARTSAETLASQQNSELLTLRAEVDQLRTIVANAKAYLEQNNAAEALASLMVV